MKKNILLFIFLFGFLCKTKNDSAKGAVIGGLGGAGIGAIAGGWKGAAIGGPIGIIGGAFLSKNSKKIKKNKKKQPKKKTI